MSMQQLYIILVSLWHFYTCTWHTLSVPPHIPRLLVQYNSFIAKSFTPDGNTSAIESPVSQVCPVDSKTPRIRWEEARSPGVFSGWPTSLVGLSPVTSIFLKRMQLYCPFWLATFHCVHMHTSLHRSSAAGYLGWSCSSCWEWRSSGQGWAGASVMCGPGASDKYEEWEEWRCGWAQGKVCLSLAVAVVHFCFQPTFNKLVS